MDDIPLGTLGLVLAVLGLIGVPPTALVGVLIGAIVVLFAVVGVYSYRVWKLDPDKRGS